MVEELNTIVDRTTRGTKIEINKIMDGEEICRWQKLVREVLLASHVQDYIVRLVLATHPSGELKRLEPNIRTWIFRKVASN